MSKLVRNRWLHASLLAGVLIALGVGIYCVEQPEPMCVIEVGTSEVRWLSDDGLRFATVYMKRNELGNDAVEVWDSRTGARIASHFEDVRHFVYPILSKNGRYFATEVSTLDVREGRQLRSGESLLLLDVETGESLEMPVQATDVETVLIFSPRGDLLLRVGFNGAHSLWVYETSTGRLLSQRNSAWFIHPADFADDALLHFVSTNTKQRNIEVWNPREGRVVTTLPGVCGEVCRSADGRYLVVERARADGNGSGKDGNGSGKWVIWNLKTHQIEAEFQASPGSKRGTQFISDDSRWLAAYCRASEDHFVEVREIPTGRLVGTCSLEKQHYAVFSPDGRFLALEDPGTPVLAMFEVPSMNMLWQKRGVSFHTRNEFSHNLNTMFVNAKDPEGIESLDCASGKLLARTPLSVAGGMDTPDRRFLLYWGELQSEPKWAARLPWLNRFLAGRSMACAIVLDTDAGRERFRVTGERLSAAKLSDDGRILITTHDEPDRRVLRCWDVDAWKPLHLPIGVPAGLGVLVVLLVWWRGRRRNLPQAA